MILVIDNYDSFTYNLVQYLGELRQEVKVVRNDETTAEDVLSMAPRGIVISPGPCTPVEAGISVNVIKQCGPSIPILGVCLGHQSIGAAYGGVVKRAGEIADPSYRKRRLSWYSVSLYRHTLPFARGRAGVVAGGT
jgi:anthranilate synthase component 2